MEKQDAEELARRLDLDLFRDGVCLPCLTFVAFPLDEGEPDEAARWARRIVPTLWLEGMDKVVARVVEQAHAAGEPLAAAALADLAARGPRSAIVRAIVMRLAQAMVVDMHAQWN